MEASRWLERRSIPKQPLGWEWGLKKKALLKFDQSCDFFTGNSLESCLSKMITKWKIKLIVNLPTSSAMFRIDRSRFANLVNRHLDNFDLASAIGKSSYVFSRYL